MIIRDNAVTIYFLFLSAYWHGYCRKAVYGLEELRASVWLLVERETFDE